MKKIKLLTAKKLTRKDLKTVSGGEGRCLPGHFEYVDFDPTIQNADGTMGGPVYKWVKGTC